MREWTATISETCPVSGRSDQRQLNGLWVRAFNVVRRGEPAPREEASDEGL
jgi:hypothetical protein